MDNDEMFRQPAEPTIAIADWEQEQRAKRQRAVEAMVFQELARNDQEHLFDVPKIARDLLEDPTGPGAQAFKQYMNNAPKPMPGWTDKDVALLGRNPESRELSPEDRRLDMHLRNRELRDSLLAAPEGENRELHQNAAANAWRDKNGRTHGTSGWLGSLQNSEYPLGAMWNYALQPFGDAAHFQFSGQAPPSKDELAAEVIAGPMARLGGIARRYAGHYLSALNLASARAAANKVARVLPAGMDRAEGHAAIERAANAGGPNFDEWYRLKYGQYPSYAGSALAVFGNGMMDPSLLVTGPAAKAATFVGKALMSAGKAGFGAGGLRGAALRGLYHYGESVAKDAAPLARYPMLQAALKEGVEETPANAGIMAALATWPKSIVEAFTPGNKARTDLYDPETGEPMSDSKFLQKMYDDKNIVAVFDHDKNTYVPAAPPAQGRNSKMNAAETRRQIPGLMHQIDETLGENRKPGWPAITKAPSSALGAMWQGLFTPSPDKLTPNP